MGQAQLSWVAVAPGCPVGAESRPEGGGEGWEEFLSPFLGRVGVVWMPIALKLDTESTFPDTWKLLELGCGFRNVQPGG